MWNPGWVSDGSLALRTEASPTRWSAMSLFRVNAVSARPPLVRELLLLLALFTVYRLGRALVEGDVDEAMTNARWVWNVERSLLLPNELGVQQWALQWPVGMAAANWYYALLHLPTMALLLAWGWRRWSREDYLWVRRLIVRLTATSFVIFALMPLAPPRLVSELAFVDTLAIMGPSAYEETSIRLANQFAAMPSLHVGWALLLAAVVIKRARAPWRWAALAHPVIMTAVVVVTANHYWIDAIVAAALLGVTTKLTPREEAQALTGTTSSGRVVGLGDPPFGSIVTPTVSPGSSPGMKCSTTPSVPSSRTPTDLTEPSPSSPITQS